MSSSLIGYNLFLALLYGNTMNVMIRPQCITQSEQLGDKHGLYPQGEISTCRVDQTHRRLISDR